MKATIVSYPEDIQCRGCPQAFNGSADSARRKGWWIGWNASMPTWCPECGGPKTNRLPREVVEPQNSSLFD